MQILVMPNLEKKNAVACTQAVISRLRELSVDVLLSERMPPALGEHARRLPFAQAVRECDVIAAIGGDGTILHSARHAVEHDKPLLGINLGRLGFMTGLELSELSLLSRLAEGTYQLQPRMLLNCVHYAGGSASSYLALNDVVVTNGTVSRMIDLEVCCGEGHPIYYRADGVILSTPTGSTAYALSAGGPMIEPEVSCISLTPICPHSLMMRTVIFSADKTVTVSLGQKNRGAVYLTVDGDQGARLNPGDRLCVSRSEKRLRLISLKDTGFFEILSSKFGLPWLEESSGAEDEESTGIYEGGGGL